MKKLTFERLEKSALFYLERYEASSDKLRGVLKRKLLRRAKEEEGPVDAHKWIEENVQKMNRLGYVNDARFAENLVRRFSQSGKSTSFIYTKLKLAGIKEDIIQNALSETNNLAQARLMVQKKHMGADFQRDLARLARAGFPYEIAKQALEEVKNTL